jgi:hypothetical protein
MTAIIGDLAAHMGCSIGLKDTVTAIVFVALGTSIPGNVKHSKTTIFSVDRPSADNYVCSLLTRGRQSSTHMDMGLHFCETVDRVY